MPVIAAPQTHSGDEGLEAMARKRTVGLAPGLRGEQCPRSLAHVGRSCPWSPRLPSQTKAFGQASPVIQLNRSPTVEAQKLRRVGPVPGAAPPQGALLSRQSPSSSTCVLWALSPVLPSLRVWTGGQDGRLWH